jgi:Family of unknown function (DUF5681)
MPPMMLSYQHRDAKGRFVKGRSGNPRGRPPGRRNDATLAAAALLEGEAEALTRKALELALAGDPAALRLCLERIVAPRRERAVSFAMPPIADAADLARAMAALSGAASRGLVTPGEAAQLAQVFATYIRAVETTDLERRLRAIEATPVARA